MASWRNTFHSWWTGQLLLAAVVLLGLALGGSLGGTLYREHTAMAALQKLETGGRSNVWILTEPRVPSAWISKLEDRFPAVLTWAHRTGSPVRVELQRVSATSGDLRVLQSFRALNKLVLKRLKTDREIPDIPPLPSLQTLEIEGTSLSESTFQQFSGLPQLTHLTLSNCQFDEDWLVHLQGLPKLRSLTLFNVPVTDAGAGHLGTLTGLELLVFARTAITDAGLEPVGRLTQLRALKLGFNHQLTGSGLAYLAPLGQLQRLSLYETGINDASLAHLTRLPLLAELELGSTAVTLYGLEQLRTCPSLRLLDPPFPATSPDGKSLAAALPRLQLGATQAGEWSVR